MYYEQCGEKKQIYVTESTATRHKLTWNLLICHMTDLEKMGLNLYSLLIYWIGLRTDRLNLS